MPSSSLPSSSALFSDAIEAEVLPSSQLELLLAKSHARGQILISNWASTQHCYPSYYHQPSNLTQIASILKFVRQSRSSLRICGTFHSPSDICCTSQHLMHLLEFNALIEFLPGKQIITVEAGMRLSTMLQILSRDSLTLGSLGSIDEQTVGGLLGTCTHGTGTSETLLSQYVIELQLLLANGLLIHCSRTHNKQLFLAALMNLGCLGIVTRVTFQAVKAFDVLQLNRIQPFDFITSPGRRGEEQKEQDSHQAAQSDAMNDFIAASPYPRLHWYPHVDQCVVTTMTPVKSTPVQAKSYSSAAISSSSFSTVNSTLHRTPVTFLDTHIWQPLDFLLNYYLYPLLLFIALSYKDIVPYVNHLMFFLTWPRAESSRVCSSNDAFLFDCKFKQHVDEWVIPRAMTTPALKAIHALIKEQGLTCDFPIEVRFNACDDAILSPANYSNVKDVDEALGVTWIGIISYRPFGYDNPQLQQYFTCFEKLMLKFGGRPHWAKAFHLTEHQLQQMYGAQYEVFAHIRQLCDPQNMFVNDFVRRVFGEHLQRIESYNEAQKKNP